VKKERGGCIRKLTYNTYFLFRIFLVEQFVIIIIIIIIITVIIINVIFFMQGIYTYIPETDHVPREYSIAAVLLLLFMVPISLVPA
jgi:hypothetical protein